MGDTEGGLPQRQPRCRKRRAPVSQEAAQQRDEHAQNDAAAASESVQVAQDRQSGDATDHADAGSMPHPTISDKHTQQVLRGAQVDGYDFEYMDHTADIQLHAWGFTLEHAFEQVALAMFNYMTPLSGIAIDESQTRMFEASGHDMQSLLFAYLDELLFVFSTELFVPAQLQITEFDRTSWQIKATGRGEKFDRQRHAQGTEVKAITYSAMDVRETVKDAEVFVIVDI